MDAAEVLEKAKALPKEDQALIINSLLDSIDSPGPELENKWLEIAKVRLEEIRTGKVKPIPADEVFRKIEARFKQ